MKYNYRTICHSNLLKHLNPRSREVITRRYGLGRPKETLESIGRSHNVTRERIRQIETDSLNKLRARTEDAACDFVFQNFSEYLKNNSSLKREDLLLNFCGGSQSQNYVYFLLTLGAAFQRVAETDNFHTFWTIDENAADKTKAAIDSFVSLLHKKQCPMVLPASLPVSYVEISKDVMQGPQGLYGLKQWPEINAKNIKDKAYVIFKNEDEPLHFMQVAELINSVKIFNNNRNVIYQTVHNELIKDSRFVLVGRGLYALREWGYEPGIIRDVIYREIKGSGVPLSKKEIIKRVLAQRKVQPSTILLNLQNKKYFAKTKEGLYTIK